MRNMSCIKIMRAGVTCYLVPNIPKKEGVNMNKKTFAKSVEDICAVDAFEAHVESIEIREHALDYFQAIED